ncbi:MAG TPA: TIGR03084 family metal-binding protein [Nocardioides sp.]|nr:TIGR03084 family metal-binding protein [Nocardioides sp.]
MSVLDDVIADLAAEGDQLRAAVAGLGADGWATPTPAEGWSVATTIGHLLWTDEVAVLAAGSLTDDGKEAWDEVVLKAIEDPTGFVDKGALELGALPPAELLARWDAGRAALVEALRAYPDGLKMPWFGPPMSPTSMATARFMETWAHALDVYDALVPTGPLAGRPEVTDRIRHVAHIGVRTRNFAFANSGLEAPAEEFRVELTAPSGASWTWGPTEATQKVTGSAYDFCQLVTQRVHRDDTDLVAVGEDAATWLTIAQAFAGPAGGGRPPAGAA